MWKTRMAGPGALAILMVVAGVPAAPAQQESPSAAGPSIAGHWVLNRALSDDPADQVVSPAVPPPVPGRPPAGRPGGRGAGPGSDSAAGIVRRAVQEFAIELTDSTVAIAYPDRDLVLHTDGRKHKVRLGQDTEAEYRAWWEAGRLVLERRLDGGLTLTEDYSAQPTTGRLHVLTRLEGGQLPRTIAFVRVYDPEEPVGDSATPPAGPPG